MPIEIRELRIRVTVTEERKDSRMQAAAPEKLQEMKSQIVRECTSQVLEKIKERSER